MTDCKDCAEGTAYANRPRHKRNVSKDGVPLGYVSPGTRRFTCATCLGASPWDVPRAGRRKIERFMKNREARFKRGRLSRQEERNLVEIAKQRAAA